jgi:hypothetical protein
MAQGPQDILAGVRGLVVMTENYMVMGQRQGDKGLKPDNEFTNDLPKGLFFFMVLSKNKSC